MRRRSDFPTSQAYPTIQLHHKRASLVIPKERSKFVKCIECGIAVVTGLTAIPD